MSRDRRSTGKRGEDAACNYLVAKGHVILQRNWRSNHHEIDIISFDGALRVVEVKTRVLPMEARPEESVRHKKQQALVSAAREYLRSEDCPPWARNAELFFDIVSVVMDGDAIVELEYIPQAFIPMYF